MKSKQLARKLLLAVFSCYMCASSASCTVIMTTKLPGSKRMPRSRLPIYSNKESKLKYCFKPRGNESVHGEESVIELTFQTPVSKKYSCVLCRSLLRDPCQVTCCGSSYCRECVNRLSTTSGKCANKNCGKNYAIITDGATVEELERKIAQLKVYCLLRDSGCKWSGTIEQLEQEHFIGADYDKHDTLACLYQEVNCPNRCGATVLRGNVVEHRFSDCENEISVCEYCGMEDNSFVIYKVHQKVCPSVPLECPNKCGVPGTTRSEILVHLENECPLRLVSCSYRHVGCEEQVRFLNLDEHNTASYQKHLDLVSEKLVFVSNVNDELRGENDKLQNNVTTFLAKLRDLQLGIGSVEDILEHYDVMDSAQGDVEASLPSSCSSGSINTLIGESSEEEDSESGYNSVVNELLFRRNPEIGLESTPAFINSENPYMNVQAVSRNRSSKVLPDVCANVPPQISNESPLSLPASDKPKGGPTIGHSFGNRKSSSISLREGSSAELAGRQFNGVSSIAENVDRLSVTRTHDKSFLDRSAPQDPMKWGGENHLPSSGRSVTPDSFDGSSSSSSPESPASEQNGDLDPWKITIPQLDEGSVTANDTRGSVPRVTFQSHVDLMVDHFVDNQDDFDVQEDDVEAAPHFDSTTPSGSHQTVKVGSKKEGGGGTSHEYKQESKDMQSHSTSYALHIHRPRSVVVSASSSPLRGYDRDAVRSRNLSSSSGCKTPPPLPPKISHTNGVKFAGTSTFHPVESEPPPKVPIKPSTIGSGFSDKPFPFQSESNIRPIPVLPPKIGSHSSSNDGPNDGPTSLSTKSLQSYTRRIPFKRNETDPSVELLSTSLPNTAPTPPPRMSETLQTRNSKPSPTRASKIPPAPKKSELRGGSSSRWRPTPPPRFSRTLSVSAGTSRPLSRSFLGGSTASIPATIPVHELDMEELKNAIQRRSIRSVYYD